ncbi:AbrB/MazE/SpoVT family DNA-binding domain-containing protein [candidate division KSB1 bacterium]|nr:AbrB/MazE/SpoVT family DNA-binding domain-containing protein [candidate division KSB1 bacterium]
MRIQVQKWGNSLAIRIPKSLALDTKIEDGSFVNLSLVRGKLVAAPIQSQEYSLEQLLAGISDDNIHKEIDTGKAMGKEIW